MKKTMAMALILMFAAGSAMAMSPEEMQEAKYVEMKKVKDAKREAKAAKREAKGQEPAKPNNGFWDREGERSGLGNSGSRAGNFFKALNPAPFFKNQEAAYNARKTGGTK